MILVTDSGSTKTDWGFFNSKADLRTFRTAGINPCHQTMDQIREIIRWELLSKADDIDPEDITQVHFYGAGCATPSICRSMEDLLHEFFPNAAIVAASDMLGAARALCGRSEGVACVLGTGSNSCLYNGQDIIGQVPSLGYILGDEGSSAALGRRLLSDCLKHQLPEALSQEFMQRNNLDMDTILDNVYRKPLPNLFLAGFSPFLSEKKDVPEIHKLLVQCFSEFFTRNVISYHRPWLPVHFVGSVAENFAQELTQAADMLGMTVGNIMAAPLEGLVDYHSN